MYSLEDLGWNNFFHQQLNSRGTHETIPARVAEELKGAYRVQTEASLLAAVLPGRRLYRASEGEDLPAVGDWVLARPLPGERRALIDRLLERRTKLSRQRAGEKTGEQVLAANVDVVFLVASLTREYNLRRIERYLTAIWDSGAKPVIALNKADVCDDPRAPLREVEAIALGVSVHVTSAATGLGTEALARCLEAGQTAVFVGSSGVGKSSLINCIAGTELEVAETRSDDKGRHTTSRRQMLVLPGRGVIIDTPGLRELQLWTGQGISQAFTDVESLARRCLFSDCRHEREPGCAVRAAVEEEQLDEGRLRSYRKLERERAYIARKHDRSLQLEEHRRWKQIAKQQRRRTREQARRR